MGNHCDCLTPKEKLSTNVFVDELQGEESKCNNNDKNYILTTIDKKTPRGVNNPSQVSLKKCTNTVLCSSIEDKKDMIENEKVLVKQQSKFETIEEKKSRVFDHSKINIALIGETGVGKSSFVIKYVSNKFETYHVVTLGTEYYSKKVKYNDSEYTLNFIVTSGVPEFQDDYSKSYQDVDFFLLMYDITNRKSFEKLKTTFQDVKKYLFSYKNKSSNVILVGNKFDIKNKVVKLEEGEVFCKADNLDIFEVSVKNNINVNKIINKILSTFDDTVKNHTDTL